MVGITRVDMGQISKAMRNAFAAALAGRHALSDRKEWERILDEFATVRGAHRKHALRLLVTRHHYTLDRSIWMRSSRSLKIRASTFP